MSDVVNYGSVLQTYATSILLEKIGYKCLIIDYKYPNEFHIAHGYKVYNPSIAKKIIIFAKSVVKKIIGRKNNLNIVVKNFQKFKQEHLKFTQRFNTPDELKANPPVVDIYIAGSDQVWSPKYMYEDDVFMLSFAPKNKPKYSIASSFAADFVPESKQNLYKKKLCEFDGITVREDNGAKIIKDLLNKDVYVCLDPTLLLDKVFWGGFAEAPKIQKPYLLVYILDYAINPWEYVSDIIKLVNRSSNYEVVMLSMSGSSNKIINPDHIVSPLTPQQFVGVFQNAACVITSSFHGTAFSVNFGKPVVAFTENNGDDRIPSFLNKVGLSKNIYTIGAKNEDLSWEYDVEKVQKKIDEIRNESISIIDNMIGKNGK